MTSFFSWIFTFSWLLFCLLWAIRSLVVRRGRKYVNGKKLVDTNTRYKVVSTVVYFAQITLTIPMFWSDSSYLLKFHDNYSIRSSGLGLCFMGLLLSVSALVSLGRNYSPCYDNHEPFQLITTGPYKFIRHPGWLSKFLVGIGGILVSGSWWFVPLIIWLYIEMMRTIQIEESHLSRTFPEYDLYRKRTFCLIPYVF